LEPFSGNSFCGFRIGLFFSQRNKKDRERDREIYEASQEYLNSMQPDKARKRKDRCAFRILGGIHVSLPAFCLKRLACERKIDKAGFWVAA
jgi:hypothetical protein